MTGRERVMALLFGGAPDRVPVSLDIGRWLGYRRTRGSLPELLRCGGYKGARVELFGPDARERLFAYVRGLLTSLRGEDRLVFSSACNTSIRAPFENLIALRGCLLRVRRSLRGDSEGKGISLEETGW